jgi:uncharacterized protein
LSGAIVTFSLVVAIEMFGQHLVEALQASGDRVIALVRQPSAHHFPTDLRGK